jgi:hypothetical protein
MDTCILTPDIPCEVVPRRDATSDELKGIGLALARWSKEELRPGGLLRSIDNIVLAELLGGDDPSELVFPVLRGQDENDCWTITPLTPPHSNPAEAARLLIVACSFCGPGFSRRRAIASLRAALPAGLVGDVVIDGRSWDVP